jgi:hypothetical protein
MWRRADPPFIKSFCGIEANSTELYEFYGEVDAIAEAPGW